MPRPRLSPLDRLFWVLARRFLSAWTQALLVVTLETVRWHRAGFRLYWSLILGVRRQVGTTTVSEEVRNLIFQMVAENPTWGAPRIHGELLMLGFAVSERTISRLIKTRIQRSRTRSSMLSFLRNHREAIAVHGLLLRTNRYLRSALLLLHHCPRSAAHSPLQRHPPPTSAWIVQQLREASPYEPATQFLILDHDSKYGTEVSAAIRSMNIKAVRAAIGCPWQNGVGERWVGGCRRELLDRVIAISESHLKRLLSSYLDYYHRDRTHCGLKKQTPEKRARRSGQAKMVARPRVGGSTVCCINCGIM